ncbi:hypothetical protein HMPREF9404_4146 [Eggerthella sp. HGA1]|nr:hypothetical protein HMPREF9404_4146 [Eggerthella sp. HGA1]
MLQNRGFGTLGALHRKRFGQNPRSRFSRGDETIVARGGGQLPKTRFCSIFQHWEAYRGPKDERVEAETNRIYKVGFIMLSIGLVLYMYLCTTQAA